MSLCVIGLNGTTAPLALREQLLLDRQPLSTACRDRLYQLGIRGAVLLATCHRSELYLDMAPSPLPCAAQKAALVAWWCQRPPRVALPLSDHFYWYGEETAVSHLMRVASGLDSPVLGEPQILGQVKQAYHSAQADQWLTSRLSRLFQSVFAVAKRVRSETDLGAQVPSVAVAACRLAAQIGGPWKATSVLLIGAGGTIGLVARYLHQQRVAHLMIANRSGERAQLLAEKFQATWLPLCALPQALARADVVISATASPQPLIDRAMVAQALKAPCRQQRAQPLLLIDLAVPRDIAAEVSQCVALFPGALQLINLDDLQTSLQQDPTQRHRAALAAEEIVTQACADFSRRLLLTQRAGAIRCLREHANQMRQRLEDQAVSALQRGEAAEQVLRTLAYKLTNQLLHRPTQLLQVVCQQPEETLWQQLQAHLAVDPLPVKPVLDKESRGS